MRFGYFKHWHQPEYPCQEFMREEGYDIEQIDYSKPKYLEGFDVAIVEQNGFNDYIENDEEYSYETENEEDSSSSDDEPKKKKGFFGRLFK